MLIVSKFHDYYDTAIGYGVDKTCVYERKKVTLKEPRKNRYNYLSKWGSADHYTNRWAYEENQGVIGFAGELYPFVEITKYERTHPYKKLDHFICYNKESHEAFEKRLKTIQQEEGSKRRSRPWRRLYRSPGELDWFDLDRHRELGKLFKEYNCPVFAVCDERGTILNPSLKEYKFVTVKDPFTAFQDIFQFMAGVLGNVEKDMIVTEDKYKIESHGFNKWSFRRPPKEKK